MSDSENNKNLISTIDESSNSPLIDNRLDPDQSLKWKIISMRQNVIDKNYSDQQNKSKRNDTSEILSDKLLQPLMQEFQINREEPSTSKNAHDRTMEKPKEIINKEISKHKTLSGVFKYEDALAETKFGKFNYGLIIISGILLAAVFIETVIVSFVLPVSQCDVELTTQQKGFVNSIGFVGIILSSHFWGFLADTTGRRKIMVPGFFIGFIFSAISSFYINFWMLIVFRFLACFFISAGSGTIYAYVGEFHTDKFRSRAIMAASVLFGIGTMCLPLVTWLILNGNWKLHLDIINMIYKPWRLIIFVFAVLDLLCSIGLWILPESPKFLFSIGKENEALKILQMMYHINTGKNKNEFPVHTLELDLEDNHKIMEFSSKVNPVIKLCKIIWHQTAPLFSKKFMFSTLLASVMQFIVYFTMQGLYVWFPYILDSLNEFRKMNPNNSTLICEVMHAKEKELILGGIGEQQELKCQESFEIETYVTSIVLEVLYIIGFFLIGLLINALGKIYILFVVLNFCGVCGVLCNFVVNPLIAGYLLVILLLIGIAVPVINAATVDLYPTNLRAMAVCITLMFGRLGSVVGSNLIGVLLDINCEMTFYISGGLLILAAFLGFLIPKPK